MIGRQIASETRFKIGDPTRMTGIPIQSTQAGRMTGIQFNRMTNLSTRPDHVNFFSLSLNPRCYEIVQYLALTLVEQDLILANLTTTGLRFLDSIRLMLMS